MGISTANYFMIFSHLSGIIFGPKHNLKGGAREEIMISTMKKLDYPFSKVFTNENFIRNNSEKLWIIACEILEKVSKNPPSPTFL